MKRYINAQVVDVEKYDPGSGYKVIGLDGNEAWCPKGVFEQAFLPVEVNSKLVCGVSIGPDMVDDFVRVVHVSTIKPKTTLVHVVLANGFEIVESSSCVDGANYSEELGAEICMEKIKNKVWELLGFLLQTAVYGVNYVKGDTK